MSEAPVKTCRDCSHFSNPRGRTHGFCNAESPAVLTRCDYKACGKFQAKQAAGEPRTADGQNPHAVRRKPNAERSGPDDLFTRFEAARQMRGQSRRDAAKAMGIAEGALWRLSVGKGLRESNAERVERYVQSAVSEQRSAVGQNPQADSRQPNAESHSGGFDGGRVLAMIQRLGVGLDRCLAILNAATSHKELCELANHLAFKFFVRLKQLRKIHSLRPSPDPKVQQALSAEIIGNFALDILECPRIDDATAASADEYVSEWLRAEYSDVLGQEIAPAKVEPAEGER